MSRTKLAVRNVLAGLVNKSLSMILEFVSRAIFIQVLGVELLGINSVFISIVQMLSLAELGVTNAMVFSFYKPLAQQDHEKLAALTAFYRRIYIAIAVVVFALGFVTVPFLGGILQLESVPTDYVFGYLLFVLDTAVSYLFVYRTTLIRADQRGFVITKYEMVVNTVRSIAQILCLVLFGNYIFYIVLKVMGTISINVLSSRRAKRDYPYISESHGDLDVQTKDDVITVIKSSFVYRVSASLLNSSTNIIMSAIVSSVVVGYLANYVTIITAVTSISVVIFTNLTASVGNLAITESPERRLAIFNTMLVIGSILTVVFVTTTTVMSNSFITLWIGERYVLPKSTVLLRMGLMFISCYMQVIYAYREAVGLYRKTKYLMLLAAVFNIVLSVLLGWLLGVDGILLASILSCVCTYFWYEPVLLYRDYFAANAMPYFKNLLTTLLLTAVLSFGGLMLVSTMGINGWAAWVLCALACFGTCFLVPALVYRKTDAMAEMIHHLRMLHLRDAS